MLEPEHQEHLSFTNISGYFREKIRSSVALVSKYLVHSGTRKIRLEQVQFWQENGYLYLPGFFNEDIIEDVNRLVREVWREYPPFVVVDNLVTGRRSWMNNVSTDEKCHHFFKLNDLYLNFKEIRYLSLHETLVEILAKLLGDTPVLINTLNMEKGTQQPYHVDALYMTPLRENNLAASWIALEDSHMDAGPLQYYPGSHNIPLYRFSNGQIHYIQEEMPQWEEYIQSNISGLGMTPHAFEAKKGDVFIWHSKLLHGGAPIKNQEMTRKSLVSHYWTLKDCQELQCTVEALGQGYWLKRNPQS